MPEELSRIESSFMLEGYLNIYTNKILINNSFIDSITDLVSKIFSSKY